MSENGTGWAQRAGFLLPDANPRRMRRALRGERAFPYADHAPAGFAQRARHLAAALRIARELGLPKGAVVRRFRPMPWAAVPKATVHKHRDALAAKDELGLSENRRIPPPAGDAVLAPPANFRAALRASRMASLETRYSV